VKQNEARFRARERRGQKAQIHANLLAWSVRGRRGRRRGWATQRQAKPLPVRWGPGHGTNLLRRCSDVGDVYRRAQRGGLSPLL